MYRHQQYESRVVEYHEDAPFFREAVTLIDQCTKLLKDDRISLRNKIKDYLRALRQNRVSENQEDLENFKQIVQIFVQANKKKSLSKIQKGDRVMDWLQIKLRKFIDQNKKEKHRKELENFRKCKFLDIKKHLQPTKEKPVATNHQQVLGLSRNNNQQQNSYNRFIYQPSSLSRSREKSPIETSRKSSQSQSYAQYSYHKNFSFLKKGKVDHQTSKESSLRVPQPNSLTRAKKLDKEIQRMNRSVDQLSKNNSSVLSKYKNSSSKGTTFAKGFKGYQLKKTDERFKNKLVYEKKEKAQIKQQISELTKLFTQQLNAGPNFNNKAPEQSFMNPTFNFQLIQNDKVNRDEATVEAYQQSVNGNLKNWSGYEESTKKIQSMLEGSRQILQQLSSNSKLEIMPTFEKAQQIPTSSIQSNMNEDIFTPPDFLAECRKLISSSNKKPVLEESQYKDNMFQSDFLNPCKLTFNNILSDSRENKPDQFHKIGSFGINESISENASVNISTKKPESQVQFQFKNISIHTVEDLLLEIFSRGHIATLDRYQIGEIMSKCDQEIQRLFQQYCDVINQQLQGDSFIFKFVTILKFFYTYGKVLKETDNHFSNFLCSILDMRKSGFVDQEALQEFIESMEASGIESQLLQQIRSLLNSLFQRCCEVQGGGAIVTRWSMFYFQLKHDSQFQALSELLGRFQFQIDNQQ